MEVAIAPVLANANYGVNSSGKEMRGIILATFMKLLNKSPGTDGIDPTKLNLPNLGVG